MMDLHKILYTTIATYELAERLRRDDDDFDAWVYLAEKIGHKNPSTLRKMCQRRSHENLAKLGFEEAIIIMNITKDYRMLNYFIRQLKAAATADDRQGDLFVPQSFESAMKERGDA